MTRKEKNKILDDKIESNVNQYKVDRLNAEISAFSSGDLNKYEFLTRKDLKYKPNALDKARFEFSPLGKTFSTRLDKTVQGYQEEGVIKLLKDIRDGLRNGRNKLDDNGDDGDDDDDDRSDDRPDKRPDDRPDDRPDRDDNDDNDDNDDKVFDVLNKFKNNMEVEMSNLDKMVTDKEHNSNTKLDRLNKNVEKLDNSIKENNNKKINA